MPIANLDCDSCSETSNVLLRKILQNLAVVGNAIYDQATLNLSSLQTTLDQLLVATKPSLSGMTTGPDIIVTNANTAVQGPNIVCNRGAIVVARIDNAGPLYIGGPNVSNASGTHKGIIIGQLGMAISSILPVSNTNQIWVNADNNNDSAGLIIL